MYTENGEKIVYKEKPVPVEKIKLITNVDMILGVIAFISFGLFMYIITGITF